MSDYISREDAVDGLHTQLMYRMGSDDMKRRLDDWVKTLPPADVVQVVRCKDCIYCDKATAECHNDRWGDGHAYYPPPVVREDGFCMDGEKRKE